MAFVPAKRPVAAAPIKFFVNNESGKQVEVSFVAQYHRHTKTQIDTLRNGVTNRMRKALGEELVKDPDGSTPEFPYESDMHFVHDKMAGWLHVKDESGAAREFNRDELDTIVEDYPELVIPLFNGFFEAHSGAKQKN